MRPAFGASTFLDLTKNLVLRSGCEHGWELLQGNGLDLPVYTVEEVSGADHQRQYSEMTISLGLMAVAKDSSRRAAEKASAHGC